MAIPWMAGSFAMDFDSLQRGELSVEYKNITRYDDFYPTEMSYDHSTGTMYVINYLCDLYEVNLETGEVDPILVVKFTVICLAQMMV